MAFGLFILCTLCVRSGRLRLPYDATWLVVDSCVRFFLNSHSCVRGGRSHGREPFHHSEEKAIYNFGFELITNTRREQGRQATEMGER